MIDTFVKERYFIWHPYFKKPYVVCNSNLISRPLTFIVISACIVLSLPQSRYPVDELNPHLVPSKTIFTDRKYLLPLTSYETSCVKQGQ